MHTAISHAETPSILKIHQSKVESYVPALK